MDIPVGIVFPQTEFNGDAAAVRDYAQTVEELGFSHIAAYDHVLGANPERPGGLLGPYSYRSAFFEPFVLFSFMAGFTSRIGFATNIIILPQRQTALAAKQAASLDVLSGGRLRLGVGLGWNEPEYIALNENFKNRGRRIEEQIQVLRALWTQPLVQFKGRWHTIPDAGLNPLPIQQPIPIWMGGTAEPAIHRAARLADGWMSNIRSPQDAAPVVALLQQDLVRLGRDPQNFGIEARIQFGAGNPQDWQNAVAGWKACRVTHLSVNTMGSGLSGPAAHLEAAARLADELGLKPK
jgi:probable F420-dependent oxidoreductase